MDLVRMTNEFCSQDFGDEDSVDAWHKRDVDEAHLHDLQARSPLYACERPRRGKVGRRPRVTDFSTTRLSSTHVWHSSRDSAIQNRISKAPGAFSAITEPSAGKTAKRGWSNSCNAY